MQLMPKTFPVTCHTDHVGPGTTFVVIPGYKQDGAQFIQKAIEQGATQIIQEKTAQIARKKLAELSTQAYNFPAKKLTIIGITGTKGKTTTTYLINHILTDSGIKTGIIGTIENRIGKLVDRSNTLTTPESDYLQAFLGQCNKQQVTHVIMEVSSCALQLYRVHGLEFDAIGFTNLAADHLDMHGNVENYFQTKLKIFKQVKSTGLAVVNIKQDWGLKALGYSTGKTINLDPKTIEIHNNSILDGLSFVYKNHNYSCPTLFGSYNAENIAMAIDICINQGLLQPQQISEALKSFKGIPGRLQKHILKNGATAIVDYAHNSVSMEAVLSTLRPMTDDLIVIFGCGGNRDKTRRPTMGAVAAKFADTIILTDDNPRFEDRQQIVDDILAGIDQTQRNKVVIELDRAQAIKLATAQSSKKSIIALLGKGHETSYIVKNEKKSFDDFVEIKKY